MYGLSHRLDVLILPREEPEKSDLGREVRLKDLYQPRNYFWGSASKLDTVTSVRPASAAQIPWGG